MKGWVGACGGVLVAASAAWAQAPREPRVVVGGGVVWAGEYRVGESAARLRANTAGAESQPYRWFDTQSTFGSALGAVGRIEVSVAPSLSIDASVSYASPTLSTTVSHDAEAGPASASERVQQYGIEVGAAWRLPVGQRARVRPFVSGGVGYLRQLHEARTMAETGQTYSGGGGVRVWLRGPAPGRRAIGVRAEARALWRRGGIDLDDRPRLFPSMSVTLFAGF